MVVVGEDDSASWANCPSHGADDCAGVCDVLEQVAGMDDVKGTPFFSPKGKIQGIAGSELDRVELAGDRSLPPGLFELFAVALDPDDSSSGTGRASHGACELSDSAADIQDSLTSAKVELAKRGLVQEIIEPGKPALLCGCGAVDVGFRCSGRRCVHPRSFHE
jgi:hypothetical protein